MAQPISSRTITANGLRFGALEAGSGPLALCLHGFPDSPHAWRHLLPALADAGFHAVAPFMRGYGPTEIPEDGCYSVGALAADVTGLHEALGGGSDAVLIGHDWGAPAAYAAATFAPERWRRVVAGAIPPPPLDQGLFGDYRQLRRFFYIFAFQTPLAEAFLAADEMEFVERLWADWSPAYDAREDLRHVKDCLATPAHRAAAIGYYRSIPGVGVAPPCARFSAEQRAAAQAPPQPTLYLHGTEDGCVAAELVRDVPEVLSRGSRMALIEHAGHFFQLERPLEVNEQIVAWVTQA